MYGLVGLSDLFQKIVIVSFQDCRFFIFTVSHPHDFENIFPGLDYFEQAMTCPDRNKWLCNEGSSWRSTVAETSIIGQIPRFSDFQMV
jgi:hypothetical protein